MISARIYYRLKPFIPWGLRIALRRARAVYKRRACARIWPIDEHAGVPPPDWRGWPDGKQFAVVLTHDVESQRGLDRVTQLMHLETRLGFRSSFNFVPQGQYHVPDALRLTLSRAGFETGVHGLKHDGKLYWSQEEFRRQAIGIRQYLQHWQAAGFRSPFMQHNLEWIHELGMEYDASTFDTDPFEPQPDGVGTIFPFWVQNPDGGGYVELPYTLVQDFNLFVILREKSIDIWKLKLHWIAKRGGMVLINTHPDYMCFSGRKSREEYPVGLYSALLSYIRDTFANEYWHALPCEVARFYRSAHLAQSTSLPPSF